MECKLKLCCCSYCYRGDKLPQDNVPHFNLKIQQTTLSHNAHSPSDDLLKTAQMLMYIPRTRMDLCLHNYWHVVRSHSSLSAHLPEMRKREID